MRPRDSQARSHYALGLAVTPVPMRRRAQDKAAEFAPHEEIIDAIATCAPRKDR